MKRSVLILFSICIDLMPCLGQTTAFSTPISVRIERNIKPAILNIISESISFVDSTENNAIDANEQCYINFAVKNIGQADAVGCKTKIRASGSTSDIKIQNISLPTIGPGEQTNVSIPISSGRYVQNGQMIVNFEVVEPHGFGTDPTELIIATRELPKPYIKIVDYAITSSQGSTTLHKKTPFDLQLLLQNIKHGEAKNITVTLHLPNGVYLMDGLEQMKFEALNAGETKSLEYSLIVTNNYPDANIPIKVSLTEAYGTCSEDKQFELQINQTLASDKIEIQATSILEGDIQVAQIGSKVDKNIPETNIVNKNTFALIIANESYMQVASVPYALNDGVIFKKYCTKTLGIPEINIHYLPNATAGQIRSQIEWIKKIPDAFPSAKIILYYAGHGIPDERNKSAYLLPIDGTGTDWNTGYNLDELYSTLGSVPAQSITIFLDACFSGSVRSGKMLANARGVAVKAKNGVPHGNMVVFAAAQGDETAFQNNKEGHGMFTYFLLKKLQESKGNVTLEELGNYIVTNVKQQSILLNGKSQTPCVTPAPLLENWQNWKLK